VTAHRTGIDLGGTKIEILALDAGGGMTHRKPGRAKHEMSAWLM